MPIPLPFAVPGIDLPAQKTEPTANKPEPKAPKKATAPQKTAAAQKTATAKAVTSKTNTPTKAPTKRTSKKAAPPAQRAKPVEPSPVVDELLAPPQPPVAVAPAAAIVVVPAFGRTGRESLHLFQQNPQYGPELLALAAVARLGGEARTHTDWLLDRYPSATPDGLARLATQRFVRRARTSGAVAGLAGSLVVLAETGDLGLIQARLVLHLAAAYGHEPTDRERAAELLVLQQIHPSVETARAALDAASSLAEPLGDSSPPVRRSTPSVAAARLVAPLTRAAGLSVIRAGTAYLAGRLVPGAGIVVSALSAARSTERLAARATRFYRALAARAQSN